MASTGKGADSRRRLLVCYFTAGPRREEADAGSDEGRGDVLEFISSVDEGEMTVLRYALGPDERT